MKKQTIAIDIDEVLSPLHDLVFAHHNAVYGTNYPIRDHQRGFYFLHEYSNESDEEIHRKLEKFIQTPEFLSVKPLEGAVKAIDKLKKNYDLVIITSRQDFYFEVTHNWLNANFPAVFKQVIFTTQQGRKGLKIPKSEFCKQIGASYIIEDNLDHVIECAATGIHSVLFGEYPWNQAKRLPKGAVRCKDWPAVLEYFDGRN